ncbi:GvpL/GvpF family gas vesicle protein [Alkalihalobacterium elongatum]|uniref:GvpL/GvpF family gas vesicle protein n=1 Tax=Alkalihalobacterium elongatum TaxID=2675466 RepID=UPI001C1F2232|nr:GvpL/GvpF family gas vesicle protein [Alkalihalobacterium elongatum]
MKNKSGIYTFCSIKTEDPATFQSVKIDQKETKVYTVHYKDIAMVVAKVPLKIYTPKKENLLAHQSVISIVMKEYAVIPISFGNVFKSEEDVIILLKKLYKEFNDIFPKIKNKFEVGLKLIGQKGWLKKEIEQNPQIIKLKKIIQEKSKDAAYYDRIKLGELTKNFFDSLQEEIIEEVFVPLSKLAVSSKQNNIVNERMLLNAAFLIDFDAESEFDNKVNELYQKWAGKVEFKYTGPWPPYNFINIKLKVEG